MRCDLWGMKLNVCKAKTNIVSRSSQVDPIDFGVHYDLVILGVRFDATMTFQKYLPLCFQSCSSEVW